MFILIIHLFNRELKRFMNKLKVINKYVYLYIFQPFMFPILNMFNKGDNNNSQWKWIVFQLKILYSFPRKVWLPSTNFHCSPKLLRNHSHSIKLYFMFYFFLISYNSIFLLFSCTLSLSLFLSQLILQSLANVNKKIKPISKETFYGQCNELNSNSKLTTKWKMFSVYNFSICHS